MSLPGRLHSTEASIIIVGLKAMEFIFFFIMDNMVTYP